MRPLNILYVTSGLNTGGAEVLLYHILAQTDHTRFAPAVITLGAQGHIGVQITELGVPVYALDMRPSRPNPDGLLRLLRVVRAVQPDLIQGWMYHGNLAAQLGGMLAAHHAPVVWCVHKSVSSLRDEKPTTAAVIWASARLANLPARIVYVSEVGRVQHERLGFNPAKGKVISNGIDAELFRPSDAARADVRAELGLPADALLIGLIARYHPQKDHVTFLRAAAELAGKNQHVYFVLAGSGVDTHNPALVALVAEHHLQERVYLLGERDDMPRLSAALDIVTSSSAFGEGLSLALAEAMACGVPCVVTDVGDSAMLVGATGLVVPPRKPSALVAAWAELIALGAAKRRELGLAARERVLQRFGIGAMMRSYEQLYGSLLGKKLAALAAPEQAGSA